MKDGRGYSASVSSACTIPILRTWGNLTVLPLEKSLLTLNFPYMKNRRSRLWGSQFLSPLRRYHHLTGNQFTCGESITVSPLSPHIDFKLLLNTFKDSVHVAVCLPSDTTHAQIICASINAWLILLVRPRTIS